jgi:hypothetical protein
MRRKQISRRHEVRASIDNIELVRAPHKSKRLNWSAFAQKMNELAYG